MNPDVLHHCTRSFTRSTSLSTCDMYHHLITFECNVCLILSYSLVKHTEMPHLSGPAFLLHCLSSCQADGIPHLKRGGNKSVYSQKEKKKSCDLHRWAQLCAFYSFCVLHLSGLWLHSLLALLIWNSHLIQPRPWSVSYVSVMHNVSYKPRL